MTPPKIHTYHCLCNSLLLASTHRLSSLPRRVSLSLDKAMILPVPPIPSTPEDIRRAENEEAAGQDATPEKTQNDMSELGYTSLLSMIPDRRVTVVRREDGFEKRILWRCGRCRLVVGYELNEEHFAESKAADGASEHEQKDAETTKIIYLLPGGILSTEVMAEGKKISEDSVKLGQADTASVSVWE